jgi:excisionase family DNA binding protein
MNSQDPMATSIIEDRLVYSVAEAGRLLGISRAFAYELVARGELPAIRLGRRRLVPKAALAALLELD